MEEENGGIIEWLLDQDLTIICYKIFSFLDSVSFTNSRLVNKDWQQFIDHHFFELKKGRKWIGSKVFNNIFDENYQPTTQRANYTERLFALVADNRSICVTTYNGSVLNYKFGTLELLWTAKLCEDTVQHCMNHEKVFAVSSGFDFSANGGNLYIISRANGEILTQIAQFHERGILGVQAFKNDIIATADKNGVLKFHDISVEEPKKIKEQQRNSFSHLHSDGDKLISGSNNGQVIAWNFETGEQLYLVESNMEIMSVRVKWPLVASCTARLSEDSSKTGVKLFNIEKEALIRHIPCDFATDICLTSQILLVSGNYWAEEDENTASHRFWNLKDLQNPSIKIEKVKKRKISSSIIAAHYICDCVGSIVVTTEGRDLVQRSFWP